MLSGSLLSVPEERPLPFPFIRKRVVVRVKEHDRSLSCLAFGNGFRRVLIDRSLSIRCYRIFSVEDACG